VKVLGRGELTKKLTVHAHAFSASAKEKIEKAGGKAEMVS
jgi:large subunit ribosomal protein L15